MKARRRVVTSGGKASTPGKRRPTVRKIKPAIAPLIRKAPVSASSVVMVPALQPSTGSGNADNGRAPAAGGASAPTAPLGRDAVVDLSVDLGRGLVLDNPILVASGTFGYGIEYGDVVEVDRLGAICCKGTTLKPRIGNLTPRVTATTPVSVHAPACGR